MHFVNSYHTQKQKVHFEFLVEFKEFAGNQLNVICVFCVTIAIEGHGVAILASLIWKAAPLQNQIYELLQERALEWRSFQKVNSGVKPIRNARWEG